VDAKITSVGMRLQELANNAHESHLVVQDLKKKMEEQEQRVGTMNTAISTMTLTGDAKPATVYSQSPSCNRPTSKIPAGATRTCSPQRRPTQQCRTSQARGISTAGSTLCGDGTQDSADGHPTRTPPSSSKNARSRVTRQQSWRAASKCIRRAGLRTRREQASHYNASSPGGCMDLSQAILARQSQW
jgi:hypothetical protein